MQCKKLHGNFITTPNRFSGASQSSTVFVPNNSLRMVLKLVRESSGASHYPPHVATVTTPTFDQIGRSSGFLRKSLYWGKYWKDMLGSQNLRLETVWRVVNESGSWNVTLSRVTIAGYFSVFRFQRAAYPFVVHSTAPLLPLSGAAHNIGHSQMCIRDRGSMHAHISTASVDQPQYKRDVVQIISRFRTKNRCNVQHPVQSL